MAFAFPPVMEDAAAVEVWSRFRARLAAHLAEAAAILGPHLREGPIGLTDEPGPEGTARLTIRAGRIRRHVECPLLPAADRNGFHGLFGETPLVRIRIHGSDRRETTDVAIDPDRGIWAARNPDVGPADAADELAFDTLVWSMLLRQA